MLFCLQCRWRYLGGHFIEPCTVLHAAQLAVGVSRRVAHTGRQQAHLLGTLQQRDVAHVAHQFRMACGIRQHQVLHGKFGIHHAARAVFHIKLPVARAVGRAHALAHGHNLRTQRCRVSRRGDHSLSHRIKPRLQGSTAQNKARPRHRLVFPGPCRVAAALLLVGRVGIETGDQQAGAAIGAQGSVDFVQIALAGLHGEPVDQLAHKRRIDLGGAFIVIVKHENDVEVAAITQLLAPQLAVANDGKLRCFAVPVLEAAPAPLCRDAQHAVGQGAEVVGHLFDRDPVLHVACQRAKGFRVLSAAQQVQQGFVVVLAGGPQRGQSQGELAFEIGHHKALGQQRVAYQFIDDAGVLQQVACGPPSGAQKVQQLLVHRGAFQQQGQITFAAQQGFEPVHEAHGCFFGDAAFAQPLRRALDQPEQSSACFVAQRRHAGVRAPLGHALAKAGRQMF